MRKSEKNILTVSAVVVFIVECVIVYLMFYYHYRKYHYVDSGKVVAKINNTKIYELDIKTRLNSTFNDENSNINSIDNLDKETFNALMLEKYSNDKILKLAEKKGMLNNNYYRFVAKEYLDRLIVNNYLNKYVFGSITEDEIKNRYNELIAITENKEERKISHILVDTEEEAKRIRNTILKMNNFEKTARQRSKDIASAMNGGCLGYLLKEEITIKEFADIAFLLKVGELSKPIKTSEGWHIIKVDDVRNIKVKTYEEAKSDIYNELKHKKFKKFIDGIATEEDVENATIYIKLKEKQEVNEEQQQDEEVDFDTVENQTYQQ
ncbi:MAG: peptidylprolyl isomerase [Rickettsiales bacterium]|nr:peptidylprolyl isomerase [Rickettsiales bacterium]